MAPRPRHGVRGGGSFGPPPRSFLGLALALFACGRPDGPGVSRSSPADRPSDTYLEVLEAASDSARLEAAVDELRVVLERSDDPSSAGPGAPATDVGPLSDWGLLLRARIAAGIGDTAVVRALVAALPPDLLGTRGVALAAGAHRAAGDLHGAVRVALGALPEAEGEAVGELLWQATEAQLARGDTVTAARLARRLLAERPLGRAAGRVLRAPLPALATAADVRVRARAHLTRGELDAAGAVLDLLPHRSSGVGDDAVELRCALAEALLEGQRWQEAEVHALRVLAQDPGVALASRAQRVLGEARLATGRPSAGRLALKRAAGGDGKASSRAALRLADLAGDDAVAARRWLTPLATAHAPEAAEARWRLGLLEYRQGAFLKAALLFDGAAAAWEGLPDAPRALFWAGLAWRQEGSVEASSNRLGNAARADPLGFYGVRARRALGDADAAGLSQLPEGPAPDPAADRLARGALHRVDALEMLGLTDDARHEEMRARDALARIPGGLHALSEALHGAGRASRAMAVAADARERLGAWDRRLLRAYYPLPPAISVHREASRRGLSPGLVAALVRRELATGTGEGAFGPGADADPELALELALRDPAASGLPDVTVAAAVFEGLYPELASAVSVGPAATGR